MSLEIRELEGRPHVGEKLPAYFTPLYREYFSAMLQGTYFKPSQEQIDLDIENQFAGYKPLVKLTKKQTDGLKRDMSNMYHDVFGDKKWQLLSGDTYYIPAQTDNPLRHSAVVSPKYHGFFAGEYVKSIVPDLQLSLLNPVQKENLLTDPSIYTSSLFSDGHTSEYMLMYGNRHLLDECSISRDTYGFTESTFRQFLNNIRIFQNKTGDDMLRGLDIGGNNGLAAYEAESLDPNLQMTNLTINPELGMWPLKGGHILVQAERLPEAYNEKFDVIISNLAFRYMRNRDIALENAIHALSVGGSMCIHLSTDDLRSMQPSRRDKVIKDLNKQFSRMEKLQNDGIIEYLPMPVEGFVDVRDEWLNGKSIIDGYLCLRKKGSIPK